MIVTVLFAVAPLDAFSAQRDRPPPLPIASGEMIYVVGDAWNDPSGQYHQLITGQITEAEALSAVRSIGVF